METQLDLTRWNEKPKGLTYRRWVVVSTGLRQLFRTRFFRLLLFLAWVAGVAAAAAGFLFSQTVVTGGWLEDAAANFGPRAHQVASAFTALILLYPDIVVNGVFTLIFWFQSTIGLFLSLIALTVVVPRLVTRDRRGNALTMYLSRPLTSLDYLVGKLGIIVGILLVTWTGPLLFGWILSVLFAPDTVFIVHSAGPLCRALLFNLIALVALAAIALGVSSVSRSGRSTTILWIGLWIVAGFFARFPDSPNWMRAASFSYDLHETRAAVFRLDDILTKAGEYLPLSNQHLSQNLEHAGRAFRADNTTAAYIGLGILTVLSSTVLLRRLKPE